METLTDLGDPTTARRVEREIVAPVDMCRADGSLAPDAVGWTRRPLHRANLHGWGRNKRFEFWCVTTPDFIVTANISDHDYRRMIASAFIDRRTKAVVATRENRWLARGSPLSGLDPATPMAARGKRIAVRLEPTAIGTRIFVEAERHRVELETDERDQESMGVLVPWSDRLFQYTRKNNGVPVWGRIVVDGVERRVERGGGAAIHDHGRGRWPYDTRWNWAAGHGECGGRRIGLQFGGRWTAGTPSTENCLRIGGRIHKIGQELDWSYDRTNWLAPWRIRGARVDLTFTPELYYRHVFDARVVKAVADQCYGVFSGAALADDGAHIAIDGVFGLAEEVHRKW
jgi:hypothetical protein